MARQLYDYWFVQFDFPDENGRPYKSSGGKMVWNEKLKREIPAGWENGTLKDFLTICNGKDHKSLIEGDFAVYGSGGLMRFVDDFLYSGESILLPRKGSLGNYMYVNEPFWTVDTMFYTQEKKKGAVKYIYYSLRYIDISRYDSGTGVPSMTSLAYYSMPFVIPFPEILREFDSAIEPWLKTIRENEIQIKALVHQRDELLPFLMNGQVSVTQSEVNCDLPLGVAGLWGDAASWNIIPFCFTFFTNVSPSRTVSRPQHSHKCVRWLCSIAMMFYKVGIIA